MTSKLDADIDALLLIIDGYTTHQEKHAAAKAFFARTHMDAEKWREKCRKEAEEERLKRNGLKE